jgi:predicted enzyme related to lactoylglutathione lyase
MVTFDALDPRSLSSWWALRTGGEVVSDDGDFAVVEAPGLRLGFQRVERPTAGKNRVHLDLEVLDRDDEVERLLLAGAQMVARHETPGLTWVVLADPEGNHFCVAGRH